MSSNVPGNNSAVVDDDIVDRVQTACTSILRLIILFKERGLLQEKYMLIIRGLARKLLEPTPEKQPICPVHSPPRSGEEMRNWQGSSPANNSFSPAISHCTREVITTKSHSSSNIQQRDPRSPAQSEKRGISPEELFNSDYLDQLMHVSDPGNYEDFCPDFMSSRIIEDPDEENRPKKCRKNELMARLRHHHCK